MAKTPEANIVKLPNITASIPQLRNAIAELQAKGYARYPSQKVNEIDNRGSTYYLALGWAKALAGQDEDRDLRQSFTPVAEARAAAEGKITQELLAAQGNPVVIGGSYSGRG